MVGGILTLLIDYDILVLYCEILLILTLGKCEELQRSFLGYLDKVCELLLSFPTASIAYTHFLGFYSLVKIFDYPGAKYNATILLRHQFD